MIENENRGKSSPLSPNEIERRRVQRLMANQRRQVSRSFVRVMPRDLERQDEHPVEQPVVEQEGARV